MSRTGQLTFEVEPRHTSAGVPAEVLGADLTLKGSFALRAALEHGDELIVTVTGPDGEVLARSEAEVSAPPSFVPIEDKDAGLLGYTRAHKARLGDPLE